MCGHGYGHKYGYLLCVSDIYEPLLRYGDCNGDLFSYGYAYSHGYGNRNGNLFSD